MTSFISVVLVYGFLTGIVYLLFSLGFSLIFGVGRVVNLAHGALYTLSAYTLFLLYNELALGLALSMLLAILSAMLAGLLLTLIIKRSLTNPMGVFLATFAAAVFVQELLTAVYGVFPPQFARPLPLQLENISVFGVGLSSYWLLVLPLSLGLLLMLYLLLNYSLLGKAVRAAAESWEEALYAGLSPPRLLYFTVALASALAGVAGISLGPLLSLTPHMGWAPLINAFAIVVLGGLGSILGTALASFILSYSYYIVLSLPGSNPTLASLVPLLMVILVLLLRPEGLLGRRA